MLTKQQAKTGEQRLPKQRLTGKIALGDYEPLLYLVKHSPELHFPELHFPELDAVAPATNRPKSTSKREAKTGGWRPTNYIDHDEYRNAVHRAHELERAGYPLNVFCTITPPIGMSDCEAKRLITLKFARLGQSLERRGQPAVGMTAFEKPIGGNLHGHSLQFVMRQNFDRIERWADRFDKRPRDKYAFSVEIHARLAIPSDIDYILKEHRWGGPEIENNRRKF